LSFLLKLIGESAKNVDVVNESEAALADFQRFWADNAAEGTHASTQRLEARDHKALGGRFYKSVWAEIYGQNLKSAKLFF
jgi:hypothetical protein